MEATDGLDPHLGRREAHRRGVAAPRGGVGGAALDAALAGAGHATGERAWAVAEPDRGPRQPGAVAGGQPTALAGPDGDGHRQDLSSRSPSIYRLIKFGGARRVLFLVDRSNLGEQAEKEFQGYRTPDDNRKFTELYNVQRLTSNTIGASSKVVITTIQRLYSMLKGEPEFDPALEEDSQFETAAPR